MVPTGIFIQTLNEMIDNHAKRLAALRGRVPSFVLIHLYVIAFVASLFAGYNDALEARHARFPVYATALLVAAVILRFWILIGLGQASSKSVSSR